MYWGFDSWTPANLPLGDIQKKYFDLLIPMVTPETMVKQGLQRVPDFWGRYLTAGPNAPTCTRENTERCARPIDATERDYLLERKVAIFLIYNNFTKGSFMLGKKGEAEGARHADLAIQAANSIVTTNRGSVWLYANIESSWRPTWEWLLGWMKGMRSSSFGGVGGFYCNTAGFYGFNEALCKAFLELKSFTGHDLRHLCKLFVQNEKPAKADPKTMAFEFNPVAPSCHPTGAAIWQASLAGTNKYEITFKGNGKKQVYKIDICTANESGMTSMLRPR